MAAKRNPTNSDISAKLDLALGELKEMNTRVITLEQWKTTEDAFKSALKQVRHEEDLSKSSKLRDNEVRSKTELFTKLIPLAIALTALALVLTQKWGG